MLKALNVFIHVCQLGRSVCFIAREQMLQPMANVRKFDISCLCIKNITNILPILPAIKTYLMDNQIFRRDYRYYFV